jgi:PAS domain S-box-containing protein
MPAGEKKNPKRELEKLKEEYRTIKTKMSELTKQYKIAQKSLEESENIFRHMPGGLAIVQNGKISQINQELLDRLGYGEEEIIQKNFTGVFHPDCHNRLMKYYRKMTSGKSSSTRIEANLLTKKGAVRFSEIRMNKIRLKNRTVLLMNVYDLERQRQEGRARVIEQKNEALSLMAKGLFIRFGKFFGSFSEYQEQLPGPAEPVGEKDGDNPDTPLTIKNEGLKILDELELMSNQEDHAIREISDLKSAVNEAIEISRPLIDKVSDPEASEIILKKYIRNVSLVKGSRREIRDVVVEVLTNAAEALPGGGEIHLTVEEHSGFARVFIQDNGAGVPDIVLDRIFDPYFTTKDSLRNGNGLCRALALIRRNGGDMEAVSSEGHGTTFIIKLPLAEKKQTVKNKNAGKTINESNALMIIKEDLQGDLLAGMVENRGGKITRVTSYIESLKLLKRRKHDFVVADYSLILPDPAAFLKDIKRIGPGVPAVIINAPADKKIQPNPAVQKADKVFFKPLDVENVIRSLSRFLAKNRGNYG